MKIFAPALLLLVFAGASGRPEPAIPYFTNVRVVEIAQPGSQNFLVVDEELWNHSRADLGDLRLYDGDSPVEYFLSEQRAGTAWEEREAKILNVGVVSGHTELDLDAEGVNQYDRIRLRLDARDFVATASVSGGGAPGKATEVQLPPSTLYDFTKEQLGSNSVLKLPTSSFRYLHVKLSPGIRPDQVKGASVSNVHEQQASWTHAGSCAPREQKQRLTLITCHVPARVPLNRVQFQIPSSQVNFRRFISIENPAGQQIATGEISRVRANRGGILVTNQELAVNLSGNFAQFTISMDNGDNPPLAITAAEPLSLERRVYFDPQGKARLALYYGDERLAPPIYDYARFFHLETAAVQAQLGPGAHNPQYLGRPDDRPWSERHVTILWTAMILAVLMLALLALRGLAGAQLP